jgi:hypothetical protein
MLSLLFDYDAADKAVSRRGDAAFQLLGAKAKPTALKCKSINCREEDLDQCS